ncbi:MAG: DUF1501 domain-containing protein [Planctomyces sp.]
MKQSVEDINRQWTRRQLLQLMAGSGLIIGQPRLQGAEIEKRGTERRKSLILLWMNGGASQLETWDPHGDSAHGGTAGEISTTVPEIRISSLLPQMAEQMQSCLVIRSLTSKEGDHERGSAFVRTGYRMEPTIRYPTLGAIAAHQLPTTDIDVPPYISLMPDGSYSEGGYFGSEWDAFRVSDPGRNPGNLDPGVSQHRHQQRLKGLEIVSGTFRANRLIASDSTFHQSTLDRALRMMSSDQLTAFDLAREPASVRTSYGDSSFGRGCLLARRLVESGVRCVEVHLPGFDTHTANHEGHVTQCRILDPAMATLIRELRERDLLDSTIVLCLSEFGRTPQLNAAAGRDHWPQWFSGVIAGGSFRRGAVVGESPAAVPDSKNVTPVNPVTIPQLCATVLKDLGINSSEEIRTPIGRPIRLADSEPVTELLTGT